jgi:hypothetical protein
MAIHNGMNVLARRLRMFRRDQHCYWCAAQTRLDAEGESNHATVDHLYSKLHPLRPTYQKSGHDRGAVLHVLACAKCNQERGLADELGCVFVPKLESRREIAELASAAVGKKTLDDYYRTKAKPRRRESQPSRRALMCETVRGFGWTDVNGDLRPRSWDEYCKHRPAFIGPAFNEPFEAKREPLCSLGELVEYRRLSPPNIKKQRHSMGEHPVWNLLRQP